MMLRDGIGEIKGEWKRERELGGGGSRGGMYIVIETRAAKRLGSDNICPKSMNGIQK